MRRDTIRRWSFVGLMVLLVSGISSLRAMPVEQRSAGAELQQLTTPTIQYAGNGDIPAQVLAIPVSLTRGDAFNGNQGSPPGVQSRGYLPLVYRE